MESDATPGQIAQQGIDQGLASGHDLGLEPVGGRVVQRPPSQRNRRSSRLRARRTSERAHIDAITDRAYGVPDAQAEIP